MPDDEIIYCVMCEKPAVVVLQGKKLIKAALCFDCANKLDLLIEHCELDWSFNVGVNHDCMVLVERRDR